MMIQQKLTPPELHFSIFADWTLTHSKCYELSKVSSKCLQINRELSDCLKENLKL